MHLVETHQQSEDSFFQGIADLYHSVKQHHTIAEKIFDVLESYGHQVYNVAVKYGPVCVDFVSKSAAKICEFSFPPFDKLPLVLQNFIKSSDEFLYLSGRGFFRCDFGRFAVKTLDTCTYSCERLLKRLELATKDTVIVLPSESSAFKSLNTVNQSSDIKDTMLSASASLDGKPTEFVQPAPKIEPAATCDNPVLSSGTESSAVEADPESERDPLAEFQNSSTKTIVYEDVTGLEKSFVLLYDMLVLCPVNATVAFIRFVRNMVRDLEESCHASKVNVTAAGRRVKTSTSLSTTALKNRLKNLYTDIVDPMKPNESILRIESKEPVASSLGPNEGPLNSLIDSVNFYWEESDPDYVPMDPSSDSYTESSASDTDISVEEINGLLSIKEKQVKKESEPPCQPKDKDI